MKLIARLERGARSIVTVVDGISDGDARWKPADEAWSILEIIRHLGDEEVDDFRTRVRMTLLAPDQDWPPIDPEGWSLQRDYNHADLHEAISRFTREREASVKWLTEIAPTADWKRARVHPQYGTFYAGQLLGAWVAHDALHLRQIAKRIYQLAERDCGHSVRYAGEWKA